MSLKRTASNQGSSSTKFKRARKSRIPRPHTSVLTAETKYFETFVSVSNLTQTALIISLSNIAQGDNYNQRNGNQVLHKYLQYNWNVRQYAGTSQALQYTAMLILDRQANGGTPLISDILDTNTLPAWFAMKNIFRNQERFRILKTHKQRCGEPGNDNGVVNDYIDLTTLDMKDRVVRFPGVSGNDPSTNALFLVLISENSTPNIIGAFGGIRWAFNDV